MTHVLLWDSYVEAAINRPLMGGQENTSHWGREMASFFYSPHLPNSFFLLLLFPPPSPLTPKPGNICNLVYGQGCMFTKSLRPLLESLEGGNQEACQNLLALRYGVETFLGQACTVYLLKDSPCVPAAGLICHVVRSSLIGYWACCGHFYGFRDQSECCQSMAQSILQLWCCGTCDQHLWSTWQCTILPMDKLWASGLGSIYCFKLIFFYFLFLTSLWNII